MTHRSTYNYVTIHANECKPTYTHTVNTQKHTGSHADIEALWLHQAFILQEEQVGRQYRNTHELNEKNHLAHAVLIHIPVHCVFLVIITVVFLLCVFSQ